MSETATAILAPPVTRSPDTLDVGALYRACADDLYAYACTVVRDPALAEEVVATTFERAFTRQHRFNAGRGHPRAWIFGIARNAAIDELRRRRRGAALTHDIPDDGPSPEEGVVERDEAADRQRTVAAAIATLPGRDRELLALKFHAGLANAEIARILGISTTNAGSRLHRVMNHLREACNVPS